MARAENHRYAAAPPAEPASTYTLSGAYGAFRTNRRLSLILLGLLILDTILTVFAIATGQILQPEALTQPTTQIATMLHWSGAAQIISRIFIILAFCIWINRSCKNAWLLDPPRMKTTPGWAAGYYFIPVLCLWFPYLSMREIRNASYGRSDKLSALLPLWWFCWIALIVLIGSSQSLIYSATDEHAISTAHKLAIVAAPVNVALNCLTIAVVTAVTLAQNKRAAEWRP